MIKQSLLKSLVGLALDEAIDKVCAGGHFCEDHPKGTMLPTLAHPNTVILFHEGGKVTNAVAGDPMEVVRDKN